MTAPTHPSVHLVMPVKPLSAAKSRLYGAADNGAGRREAHTELVTAVVLDTVAAARAATCVTGVTVVTPDSGLRTTLDATFRELDVETLDDTPAAGLNAALRHGAAVLAARGVARIGALQADLPALRPDELDSAVHAAGHGRAFCPDLTGTGTTLLLAAYATGLFPRFGPDSAAQHARSGAKILCGPWCSLRCDVDTVSDLDYATTLGLGPRTMDARSRWYV